MTVSSVLNGAGTNVKVRPAKAEKIREVARALNYQPNHVARSLRNRKTGMIGVVFQHFERIGEQNPYYPHLLNGVMSALFPANYTLALCPKLIVDGNAGIISDGRFDGVLWCRPDFSESSIDIIQHSVVPVVMMHAPAGTVPGIPTFCADNAHAMNVVVQHLTELGHTKIAFVSDPINVNTVEGRTRRQAFFAAMELRSLQGESLEWTEECPQIAQYANGKGPYTALVCFSDTLASWVLNAAEKAGVSIPNDVSVVGFDSTAFCDITKPKLTSVRQPVKKIAQAATLHLLSLIRDQEKGQEPQPALSSIYTCGLDVRESTSRPITHS